jgi:membrane protease YdiL (CAAX protease family)
MGFCSFTNIAMSYASRYFRGFGVEYEVDFGENPPGIFGFLLTFIATAIVPALVEEFACRGIVLGILRKFGSGFAIITSSLIFGIMHGNFEQIPFAIMVGLILGYVYVKTDSLWPGIVIHGINNAISVIFNYLGSLVGSEAQNILYIVYLIFSMLMIVVGVFLFAKNTNDDYELQKSEDTIAIKDKYIYFFTSWAIIVFIVLNLIEAMSYFVIN